MKTFTWLGVLFLGVLACSKSVPDPVENATAMLNGQLWSGITNTWRNQASADPCAGNTVNLSIQNKLPYPKARAMAPTLCGGYCGDQSLTLTKIPLAVGVYTLSTPKPCPAIANQVGISFMTLVGGDVPQNYYQIDTTKTGTLKITKYDSKKGEIEGSFEVTLNRDKSRPTSDAAETLHFQNGLFRAKLP